MRPPASKRHLPLRMRSCPINKPKPTPRLNRSATLNLQSTPQLLRCTSSTLCALFAHRQYRTIYWNWRLPRASLSMKARLSTFISTPSEPTHLLFSIQSQLRLELGLPCTTVFGPTRLIENPFGLTSFPLSALQIGLIWNRDQPVVAVLPVDTKSPTRMRRMVMWWPGSGRSAQPRPLPRGRHRNRLSPSGNYQSLLAPRDPIRE